MAKPVFIYCLKEPLTGEVRYIGQTTNLKKRLYEHIRTSSKKRNYLGNWLRSLKGEKPVLAVLHEVSEGESWQEEERRYIFFARGMGVDLVNNTDGGEGASNPSIETRKKIGAAHKGVRHSPEARAKMSASRTGLKATPEHKAAVSAGRKGMKFTPEHCAAISVSKRGKPLSPAQQAANKAQKGMPWSAARRAAQERRKLAKSSAK